MTSRYPFQLLFPGGYLTWDSDNLVLGSGTTFYVQLNPFLYQQEAFYLNQIYLVQVLINGTYYYLNNDNSLSLTSSPLSLSFKLLDVGLSWGQQLYSNGVTFYNLSISGPVTFIKVLNNNGSCDLVVLTTQCTGNANFCGQEICPPDFVKNSAGDCVDTRAIANATTTFGLRFACGDTVYVITYDISGTTITLKWIPQNLLTSSERWFYIDSLTLFVGTNYPIYIITSGGRKFYLSRPVKIDNFTYNYQALTKINNKVLSFTPSKVGNWNEFTYSPSDFSLLRIPSTSLVALWQNPSKTGTTVTINPPMAVTGSTDFSGKKVNKPTSQATLDKTNTKIRGLVSYSQPINATTSSINWLWVSILIIALLIIFAVVLFALWKPAEPQTQAVIYNEQQWADSTIWVPV